MQKYKHKSKLKAPNSPLKSRFALPVIPKVNILGVDICDISSEEALQAIIRLAKVADSGHYVVTVNPEFVMLARKNKKFAEILDKSDLSLPDGAGVVFSKLIFGGRVKNRITGVDLVENLCSQGAKKAIKIGFLGGFGSVAEVAAKRQVQKYPGLNVVFAKAGDPSIGYDSRLDRELNAVGRVDILFVAYGMGQQEFWISRHKNLVNVGVFIGVGGALDYIAGVKQRAPKIVQNAGFEWLWRLVNEPYRIWRMRVLPVFFVLTLIYFARQIFTKNNNL